MVGDGALLHANPRLALDAPHLHGGAARAGHDHLREGLVPDRSAHHGMRAHGLGALGRCV